MEEKITRYKMYKSRDKWVVAGISMCGGILAMISGNGGAASANSISQINSAPNNSAQETNIISNNSITSQSLKQQSSTTNNNQNTTNNTIKDNQVSTNNISIDTQQSNSQNTSKVQGNQSNSIIKSTNNDTTNNTKSSANLNSQNNLNNKNNQIANNISNANASKVQINNRNTNNSNKNVANKNTQDIANNISANNSNINITNNSQSNNNNFMNNSNNQSSLENTINNQNYSSQDKNVINALLSGKQVKSDDIRAKNLLINIGKQYYDVIDNNGVLSLHKITNITTGINHYQGLTSLQDNTIAQNQTMQVSSFQTDKAEYMPGDTVKISIVVKNNISVNQFGTYKVNVYNPLSNEITIATGSWKANANGGTDPIIIDWKTPNIDNKGYIINVQLLTTEGKIVGEYDNAVDVCSDWRKHPRYGALTNFSNSSQNSGNNIDLDVDAMAKDFHLDAAMLYDAYFRPQNPLPTNMNGSFTDWIGDQISEDLIKQTISRQHQDGMKSFLYNMINATTGFPTDNNANMNNTWQVTGSGNNRQLISPWGIYNSQSQMEHFDMLNGNEDTQRQWYYNPASKDWQNYIGNIMKETLDYFGFDGWQGDTLGNFHDTTYEDRGNMSKAFNSDSTYQDFANAIKKILGNKEFGMNAVNAGGEDGLAKSNADWQYMELWPGQYGGFTTYESLAEEITNVFNESGKSPIVPAYMYNQWRKDQTAASNTMPKNYNDNALRLQWATIMANGGSPMNIADDGLLINNEYYPGMRKNNQISMDDAAGNTTTGYLRHYYDFLTAYENLLQDPSMKRNNNYIQVWNGGAVNKGQCINHDDARTNSVYAFSRSNGSTDTISLINLMGTNNINWQVNNNLDNSNKNINQQKNLWIKYYPSEQNQNITHVYMSSPDSLYQSKRIEIPFVEETDQSGHKYLEFEVPNLDVWDLIYMTSNQLSTVPTTSATTNTNNQSSNNNQNKPSSSTNSNNQKPSSNTSNSGNKNNGSSSTSQVKPSSGIQTGGSSSNNQEPSNSQNNNNNQNKPSQNTGNTSNINKPSNSQSSNKPSQSSNSSQSNNNSNNKPNSNTNNSNQSGSAGDKGAETEGVDKNNQNNGGNKQSGNTNTNNGSQNKNDNSQSNNGNTNSNNTPHNNQPSNSDNSNTHSSSANSPQQTGGISTSDPSMSLGREVAKFGNYVWFESTDSKGSSIEFAHLNTGKYQSLGDYDNVSNVEINKNNNIISFSYEKNGKKYYIEFNDNTSNNNEVDAESSDYESSYLADAKSSFGKSAIYVGDNTQYNANDPMLKHEKAVTIYKYGDHYEMSPASDGMVSHFNYDSKDNTVKLTATGIAPASSLPIDNIKINGNSVIVMVNNKPYTFTNNWLGNTQNSNSSNQPNKPNSNNNTGNSSNTSSQKPSNTNKQNSSNNQKPSQSNQSSDNKNNSQSSNNQSNSGMSNSNNQNNTNSDNSNNQSNNTNSSLSNNSLNSNSQNNSNKDELGPGESIFDDNGNIKSGASTVKPVGDSEAANEEAQSNDANKTSNNQLLNNAELNASKNNIGNNNMNYASNSANNIDYLNEANNSINNNRAINSADFSSPKHSSINQVGNPSLNNKLKSNNLPQTGDSELFELSLLLLAELGLVGIIKIKK